MTRSVLDPRISLTSLSQVNKVVLSSVEDVNRPPEVGDFLHGPLTDMMCQNKDGNGDATGSWPTEVLSIFRDTFLGYERRRLAEREGDYLEHLQARCSNSSTRYQNTC